MGSIDLHGRVVVVTGASRGLGAGMADRFAELGARVGRCARKTPVGSPSDLCRAVDVVDANAVERFANDVVAALGPIDLWVNNAGAIGPMQSIHDADLGHVADLFDVNLLGTIAGTQAFVRHRRDVGPGGTLINISSGAAKNARAGWASYGASKAAVDLFTEAVALEEEAYGLSVHSIAPGVVDTDMQAEIRSVAATDFPTVEQFHEMKRTGRYNSAAFVADELLRLTLGGESSGVVERVRSEWETS